MRTRKAVVFSAAGPQICSRATRNPTVRWFYRPLPKRVLLTCTTWMESHNTGDDGRGKRIDPVETELLAFLDLLATGRRLLGVLFVAGQKSNLCTALATQNTTENNCIVLHAQNASSLHPDVLLTGMHWWVVTSKGMSAFPTTNNCQGQLQTPQSLSTCHVIIAAVCTKATACAHILSSLVAGH